MFDLTITSFQDYTLVEIRAVKLYFKKQID